MVELCLFEGLFCGPPLARLDKFKVDALQAAEGSQSEVVATGNELQHVVLVDGMCAQLLVRLGLGLC